MSDPVILLVDRDTRTLEVLHAILRRFKPQAEVLTTDSAEKAVDLMKESDIDLLACDCAGGKKDDQWLRTKVRKEKRFKDLPILYLAPADRAPELEVREYQLAKPFSALALVDKIDEILTPTDGSAVRVLKDGSKESPILALGPGGQSPPTTIIRTKFAEVMEGKRVRITQLTDKPVSDDLIKRHLLFSRAIQTYRIQEHLMRAGDEVHFEVAPSKLLPGYNELRFEVAVRGGREGKRAPVMPEFLLARTKEEISVAGEIDRVTRFVSAKFLTSDLDVSPGALLGDTFVVRRVEFPAGTKPGAVAANVRVTLGIDRAQHRTLDAYWKSVCQKVEGADHSLVKKMLVEAILGIEDFASRSLGARNRLSKAALYLSALVLVVQDHWKGEYAKGSCRKVRWPAGDARLAGVEKGGGAIEFDDPLGRVLFDDAYWFEIVDAYVLGDRKDRTFSVEGVEIG
ncbi:MAG: hypothetical protein HY720_13925 [Planctomycetes bacterium]|nr:hypothetical protein [Planctomycetota bacterium]